MVRQQQKLPEYGCTTCKQCQNSYCMIYKRRVEDYNRCFNHTNYHHTNPIKMEDNQTLEYLIKKAEQAKSWV